MLKENCHKNVELKINSLVYQKLKGSVELSVIRFKLLLFSFNTTIATTAQKLVKY